MHDFLRFLLANLSYMNVFSFYGNFPLDESVHFDAAEFAECKLPSDENNHEIIALVTVGGKTLPLQWTYTSHEGTLRYTGELCIGEPTYNAEGESVGGPFMMLDLAYYEDQESRQSMNDNYLLKSYVLLPL